MPGRRDLSLKSKSIIGVLGLILILSALNSVTFLILRGYMGNLSDMIDFTVVCNDLRGLAGKATEGLPREIEEYSLHPSDAGHSQIQATFTRIEQRLASLDKSAVHPDVRVQLQLVGNMFQSLHEHFEEIDKLLASKGAIADVNARITGIREGSGLISDAILQMISDELGFDQKSKAELGKHADTSGKILILAIALTCVLGFFLFYTYLMKRSILRPLDRMRRTMGQVATDASAIQLRVTIERRDEMGQLGEYFNKMADTIQTYKESLEELVETRTRQLSDAQALLVQSGKLSALGEMAGGIAHEVNNPLAVIQMNSQVLLELVDEEPLNLQEIKTIAGMIDVTVNRIGKIVKGLRSFSRDATNDPSETVDLKAIVDDTLALCSEKLKTHRVRLKLAEIPRELQINCRPTEISQVLLNLLSNSFDAVMVLQDRWIEVRIEEQGGMLEISVSDSGPGIPEAIREKIFQPFFTTKEIGKGTGLGLSIAKRIIEGHGGSFGIDSACAHTRLVIRLPRAV